MGQRPNFLFIMTDQHRYDHLGCMGNPYVRTPNLDHLAAEGTIIDRFYVALPICMPNRASLMTGRMPSLHGVRHNGIPLDLDATTFVHLLREAGYHTALIGKSQLQPITNAPPAYAFPDPPADHQPPAPSYAEARRKRYEAVDYQVEAPDSWQDPDFEPPVPYYGFDHVRISLRHGDTGGGHFVRWLAANRSAERQIPGPDHALERSPHHPQAYQSALPPELHPTSFIAQETMAYLDSYAQGDQQQPFFVQCSFPDPHHPFAVPGHYWDMYDPDEIALPPSFYKATHDQIPPLKRIAEKSNRRSSADFFTEPFIFAEPVIRELIAKTWGMITFIDDTIGRIVRHLETVGLAKNTVICFVSDHGDWMGDHGLILKDALHYQSLIRVPFIWRDPDATYNSGHLEASGNFLDLSRTILARAKVGPHNGNQGYDLLPVLAGDTAAGRHSVLIEHTIHAPYLGVPLNSRVFSHVDDHWRLTIWEGQDWGELYDRNNDPGELVNLWEDPAHAGQKSDLLLKMTHNIQTLNDNSPVPPRRGKLLNERTLWLI